MLKNVHELPPMDDDTFESALPALRVDLLNAQVAHRDSSASLLIILAGDDRWGCSELLDTLHEWLDARRIQTRAFSPVERHDPTRPLLERYWNALPRRGQIGIFAGAWPLDLTVLRARKRIKRAAFEDALRQVSQFETTLANNGTHLLKLWLHLPPKSAKSRIRKALKHDEWRWRMDRVDRFCCRHLDDITRVASNLLKRTNSPAPWRVIPSPESNARDWIVGSEVRDALQTARDAPAAPSDSAAGVPDALGALDLTPVLPYDDYKKQLDKQQSRLARLMCAADERGQSTVLVFEGPDAAGKGGAIRRLTRALPARCYRVIPIGAPTTDERAHHYLWRFWRRLPEAGQAAIFDRSWYGRVLVERVEGFAKRDAWNRAFDELNSFEAQLAQCGFAIAKFWLHVGPDEQLRRFKAREQTAYKKYKITEDDYRNRGRWDEYIDAANEMFARTSTKRAPWHVISANDKRWARVRVIEHTCDAIEKQLNRKT